MPPEGYNEDWPVESFPLENDSTAYNAWRRDIIAEYFLQTGRTFPRSEKIARLLVQWSDGMQPPTPTQAVNILICDGYLKP